ncbi:MAG: hypothetical protein AAF223_20165, partial [Bacteroidota bacterium]
MLHLLADDKLHKYSKKYQYPEITLFLTGVFFFIFLPSLTNDFLENCVVQASIIIDPCNLIKTTEL